MLATKILLTAFADILSKAAVGPDRWRSNRMTIV
jgi:hypothetical protein